ncbi:MAG TPA: hypothetical protein VGX23_10005 [Actinocrinis sp.]|nr:hypothetical protein [Actinocrinis sp.]
MAQDTTLIAVEQTTVTVGDDGLLYETETWFVRRGLPYFIEDYKATDDVFTKALPLLIVCFIVNLMIVLSLHLTVVERIGGAALGTALILLAYLVRNLVGGRKMLSAPNRIGWVEVTGFVLIPPIVDYATRRRVGVTVADLCLNVGVVLAIYVFASALLPLGRWALQRTFQELGETFDLAARALPLLFLFNSFLFISKDVWEFAANMGVHRLLLVVALFGLCTVLFLLYRLPEEVGKVAAHDDRTSIASACLNTPMDGVYDRIVLHEGTLPLTRAQRTNILMILFVGQILQVGLLTVLVWVFFIGFGAVTLTSDRINDWVGKDNPRIIEVMGHPLAYHGLVIDVRLVAVAVFLAAVSGFFFAVSSLTDEAYKDQFFARMHGELETAIQVRRVYLALYQGRHAHDNDDLGISESRLWERIPRFHHASETPEDLVEELPDGPLSPAPAHVSGDSPSEQEPDQTVVTGVTIVSVVPGQSQSPDQAESVTLSRPSPDADPQPGQPDPARPHSPGHPHEHRRWFDGEEPES